MDRYIVIDLRKGFVVRKYPKEAKEEAENFIAAFNNEGEAFELYERVS